MDSVYLKKILLKNLESDKKCYIYLHSEWDQKKLVKLYIKDSSTQHCYEGKIETKDFEEAAEELDISLDEYLDVLKKVLTTDIGLDGFEIELDHENKIMRVNRTRDLHIMYVEIQLQEANKNYDMLDIALQKINNEKSKNEDQVIEKALSNAIGAVEKVLLEKEEWKEKMLAKFLLILNEKKNKIAKLEMELEKVSKGGSSNSNAQMDIQDSSDDDFNAPTQRLTPPPTVA
ncbi:DNA repair protein XRCC4-like [Bactrocera neohumeralis]|uniref:DNA repair protein XRCC4-like n=1 Tax=Bactrocera neohumeralis TaxID=98809 RepID=UPI002165141B|nr:DNA repair protein XRCC4-like [Bactrocera neohumeralis]